MMRVVLFCLLLAFSAYAQDGINTGEGLQALYFPGNGGVELATSFNRSTLSANLLGSFTFEAWIMLPNPPADGLYKSIVARWDIGPDKTYHNRWSDFDFQVQASGTLNFFMGNGGPSIYGILISTTNVQQGVWSHVAFSVAIPSLGANPSIARVYYDLVQWNKTWTSGNRQLPPVSRDRNIFLGDYFNQDGDHKWWIGYMDEVRFWSEVRTDAQLAQYRQRVPPLTIPTLLAYYRFNDGAGLYVQDSTVRRFDGRLSLVTATTSSPLWRVSGAKINVDARVDPQSISTIFLPGFSPTGSLSFTYVIESTPSGLQATGVGKLLANGQLISNTPFALLSNQVTYEAPNSTGVVISFTYYGTRSTLDASAREKTSTVVFLQVGDTPCIPDMCGRCGGDNSSCTCLPLPYNGYNLNDIERILLLYEIEQTLDLLTQLEGKLEQTVRTLGAQRPTALQPLITEVQQFNTGCLLAFCEKIDLYTAALSAIGPQ